MSKTRNPSLQSRIVVAHQEDMLQSRRNFLKGMAFGAAAIIVDPVLSGMSAYAAEGGDKVLILYFSHSGNTRRLAE